MDGLWHRISLVSCHQRWPAADAWGGGYRHRASTAVLVQNSPLLLKNLQLRITDPLSKFNSPQCIVIPGIHPFIFFMHSFNTCREFQRLILCDVTKCFLVLFAVNMLPWLEDPSFCMGEESGKLFPTSLLCIPQNFIQPCYNLLSVAPIFHQKAAPCLVRPHVKFASHHWLPLLLFTWPFLVALCPWNRDHNCTQNLRFRHTSTLHNDIMVFSILFSFLTILNIQFAFFYHSWALSSIKLYITTSGSHFWVIAVSSGPIILYVKFGLFFPMYVILHLYVLNLIYHLITKSFSL